MIAKLIVWDATARGAAAACARRWPDYEVARRADQSRPAARRSPASPASWRADLDTGFLGRHPELLQPPRGAAAGRGARRRRRRRAWQRGRAARRAAAASGDPHSPLGGTRPPGGSTATAIKTCCFRAGEAEFALRAHPRAGGSLRLELDGGTRRRARATATTLVASTASAAGLRWPATGRRSIVFVDGAAGRSRSSIRSPRRRAKARASNRLLAPMPGRIVSLHTAPGAAVTKGDVLLVLEAMKVQMRLAAPRDGTVGPSAPNRASWSRKGSSWSPSRLKISSNLRALYLLRRRQHGRSGAHGCARLASADPLGGFRPGVHPAAPARKLRPARHGLRRPLPAARRRPAPSPLHPASI